MKEIIIRKGKYQFAKSEKKSLEMAIVYDIYFVMWLVLP